jgi:hypothetical protein
VRRFQQVDMTIVSDSQNQISLKQKIENLLKQIDVVLNDDFPIIDGKLATKKLKQKIEKILGYVLDYPNLSSEIQNQIYLNSTAKISSTSVYLGMIVRSNTTRNPFELYDPFKIICQKFFEEDIFLILSSEWNYIPFTYPMNIEDLPAFIVIGMPASESENVLIFPAAGHELGHSIWFKGQMAAHFSGGVFEKVRQKIESEPKRLVAVFSNYSIEQFETDLFAKGLKELFLSDVTAKCMRQIEEVFCDFIALLIFGKSYLYAFRYLLAPGGIGKRSPDYPDTKDRAEIIEIFAKENEIVLEGFASAFRNSHYPQYPYEQEVVKLADEIRSELVKEVAAKATEIFNATGIQSPRSETVRSVITSFSNGLPWGDDVSIGELIEAGWERFVKATKDGDGGTSGNVVEAISDLVLKSAESVEFLRRVRDA